MVEKLGLLFHNMRALHQKVDSMPDKAGEWQTRELKFNDRPDEIFTVRFRDPVEAIKGLWKDRYLSPKMVFSPAKIYTNSESTKDRIFSEMWTGKWWHVLQVGFL